MNILKKLTFAPLFLVFLTILLYFFSPLLSSLDIIFSLSLATLYQLITLSGLILLISLFFILFGALSLDWKLSIPVMILASFIPVLFVPPAQAIVLGVAILVSLVLTYLALENKMKGYFSFHPATIFSPPTKQLAGLLILALSITYYLSINQKIQKEGFEIPDSLIDTTLQIVNPGSFEVKGVKQLAQTPTLTQQQIDLLKSNPDLLRQYNIDPALLDTLTPSSSTTPSNSSSTTQPSADLTQMIKPLIKDQLQNIIKPYQSFIPAILAVLLFLTLQAFVGILSILLSPLLWLIFYLLEKTKFVTFTSETREVKKLVI